MGFTFVLGSVGSRARDGDPCGGNLLRGGTLKGDMGEGNKGSKLRQEMGSSKNMILALSLIVWGVLEHELHHRVISTLRQEESICTCPLLSLAENIGCWPFRGMGE